VRSSLLVLIALTTLAMGAASVSTTVPAVSAADPALPVLGSIGTIAVWTTSSGLALYEYSGDTVGVSNCIGDCANAWPPFAPGPDSVAVGGFTIVARSNPNGSQWAYHGMSLYTFGPDTPANPTGNGQNGFTYATPDPTCTGSLC
jgi:predicted lipoprotein with Yx(FWY)xxD motif